MKTILTYLSLIALLLRALADEAQKKIIRNHAMSVLQIPNAQLPDPKIAISFAADFTDSFTSGGDGLMSEFSFESIKSKYKAIILRAVEPGIELDINVPYITLDDNGILIATDTLVTGTMLSAHDGMAVTSKIIL
jgi:hypothetical protein